MFFLLALICRQILMFFVYYGLWGGNEERPERIAKYFPGLFKLRYAVFLSLQRASTSGYFRDEDVETPLAIFQNRATIDQIERLVNNMLVAENKESKTRIWRERCNDENEWPMHRCIA
ncbi:hypothetical protein [Herbaspirillum sp.]|uniref:hypothetical protein n=1 Tax=Herbaspirillum sp. TaxID=1890675 RepID=UPI001B0D54CB|nr:hypothetical protein [Herbaspirillum sp.]MBO9537237.1 hypothetical protein [Herbaspirillum sp.]